MHCLLLCQDPTYRCKDVLCPGRKNPRNTQQFYVCSLESRAKYSATSTSSRTDGDALYPCRHEQNRSDLKQKACSECLAVRSQSNKSLLLI